MSRIDDVSTAQTAASRDGAASRWLKWVAEGLLICFALRALAVSESLPQIFANQNHAPAGIFRDGVLSINIEVAERTESDTWLKMILIGVNYRDVVEIFSGRAHVPPSSWKREIT